MLAITQQEFERFTTHYWFLRQRDPTVYLGRAFVEYYDLEDDQLWMTRNDDAAEQLILNRYARKNYWTDVWTKRSSTGI